MPTNRTFLIALSLAAQVLDVRPLRPVHRLVGAFLRFALIPILGACLKQKFALGPDFKLICRHSVLEAETYHFLYSDIDLSAIVGAEDLAHVDEIRTAIDGWRKIFIFLGELEIYTAAEQRVHGELLAKPSLYAFLRDIRKLTWIQHEERLLTSRYHSLKRRRAIKKILRKVGASDGAWSKPFSAIAPILEGRLVANFAATAATPAFKFNVYCPHMAAEIVAGDEAAIAQVAVSVRPTLKLSAPVALCLLAIVPFEAPSDLTKPIAELRRDPAIRREWQLGLQIEALSLGGGYRGRPHLFPWIPQWQKQLEAWRFEVIDSAP